MRECHSSIRLLGSDLESVCVPTHKSRRHGGGSYDEQSDSRRLDLHLCCGIRNTKAGWAGLDGPGSIGGGSAAARSYVILYFGKPYTHLR